jgi:hypothetical protein
MRAEVALVSATNVPENGPSANSSDPPAMDQERMLRLLYRDGDVVELRILNAGKPGITLNGFFEYGHLRKALRAVNEWDGRASGIYVALNPVDPRLLARCANRLQITQKEQGASDKDILVRRWMLVDFDPIRPAGISASAEEHEAALALARKVRQTLSEEGWPLPIYVDSGNGAYLIYRLPDLLNDPTHTTLIKGVLAGMAQRFRNEHVEIDPVAFNASRLGRLAGTLNAKGDNLAERPWRRSRLLEEQ